MKGYWIARVDVTDPEAYKKYVAANAEAFGKYDARFLVRGGTSENAEGSSRARNVVLEFASYDQALACYHSPEYQRAKALRMAASEGDLVIVEGYDQAQDDGQAAGGYWVVRGDVSDPEQYKKYVAANAASFAEYGARFVVRGGRFECPEGTSRSRNVVIAFDSFDKARECYHSPGYQAAIALRTGASVVDVVIVEGYQP